MVSQKDVMNDAYTAAAITASAVGVSYVSRRFLKTSLGAPETVNGAAKLAVAVGLGTLLIKTLQEKKIFRKNWLKIHKKRIIKWQV